jgi:O-succinylbenzoic acid--CoA ligase
VGRLVGVIARGVPGLIEVLQRTWDAHDAVLPIDPRLPAPARAELLAAARPTMVIDAADPLAAPMSEDPDAPPVAPGDAVVIATSGTTGRPKLVVLTHDSLRAHAHAVHTRLEVERTDRWLACLPLAHIGGLNVVIRSLLDGIGLEVHDGFEPTAVQVAAASGATLTSLVPTALDRIDPSGFRWIVLGGAADPTAVRPANVVRSWGLTETGGGVVYGGEPLPGVEVIETQGELWVRSPTLARGLRLSNGDVTEIRRPHPLSSTSTGWLQTGDLGSVSADGTVTVHGRLDDVIVTGGENVHPEAIEAVLLHHPSVAEAAVVGRPDPEWGHRVEAWIVLLGSAVAPTLEELQSRVRAELPAWNAPKAVHFVAALPRTPLGKLDRRSLAPAEAPDGSHTTEMA